MKPSSTRFWPAFLLVLSCSACCTQWWLVTIRPSGDTNDAVQPPSETTALSGDASGSDSVLASIGTPMLWNVSTCSGSVICCGNHMPPGFEYCSRNPSAGSGAGAGALATGSGLGGGVVCPVLGLLVASRGGRAGSRYSASHRVSQIRSSAPVARNAQRHPRPRAIGGTSSAATPTPPLLPALKIPGGRAPA